MFIKWFLRLVLVSTVTVAIVVTTLSFIGIFRGVKFYAPHLQVEFVRGGIRVDINTARYGGNVPFKVATFKADRYPGISGRLQMAYNESTSFEAEAWGFGIQHYWLKNFGLQMTPYWVFVIFFPAPLLMIPGAITFHFRKRLWKTHVPGTCTQCHYDLRGTEGNKCPECGAPVLVTPQ